MKTLDYILEAVSNGKKSNCLGGRGFSRLVEFIPAEYLTKFGFKEREGKTHTATPLTQEIVLERLKGDLDFAFEKALNKRGLSSGMMFEVIKMWMWVLDDPLAEFEDYAMYGLPLFKAVALKYNLPNLIGEDTGSESKYDTYED